METSLSSFVFRDTGTSHTSWNSNTCDFANAIHSQGETIFSEAAFLPASLCAIKQERGFWWLLSQSRYELRAQCSHNSLTVVIRNALTIRSQSTILI